MNKPEWIELNLPFGPVYDHTSNDFRKQLPSVHKEDVIRAGVLLEFADTGEKMLVGHVNLLGGLCDDCAVNKDRVVKRYKVIWEGDGS